MAFVHICAFGEFDIYNQVTCAAMYQKHDANTAKSMQRAMAMGGTVASGAGGVGSGEWGVVYGPEVCTCYCPLGILTPFCILFVGPVRGA